VTTQSIDIRIREDGSRVVATNIGNVGEAAEKTGSSLDKLKGILAAAIGSEIIHQLIDLNDEYTRLQNRLRLTTTDQANLNAVFLAIQDIATKTRSELGPTVEIYQRLSGVSKELGLSQQDVIDFTLRLNEAVKLSGVTSQEAANGIRQLAQGIAAGKLQGQDLRAALEDIPSLGNVIAQGMGVTRNSLRQLGEEGKITAGDIVAAFKKMGASLDADFAKTLPTVADGFTNLKNVLLETVGQLGSVTGAGATLGGILTEVANTIKAATPEILNFARALFGALDPQDQLSEGSKVFATILISVITVLTDLAKILYTVVATAFQVVGKIIGAHAAAIFDVVAGIVDSIKGLGQVLGGLSDAVALSQIGQFKAAGEALVGAFTDPFKDAKDDFASAGAVLGAAFEDITDTAVGNTSDLIENILKDTQSGADRINQIWDSTARNVQDRTKDIVGVVSTTKGPAAPIPIDPKVIEKLRNELRNLLNTIDPIHGAILQMAKDAKILDDAQKAGLITKSQEAVYLAALAQHYKDILDPLGKVNREIDQQTTLLQLNVAQREVESQVLAAVKQLQADGVNLTQEEITALRAKYKALQDLNAITQQQDQLLSGSVDARKTQVDQLTAITKLLADPKSGFTKNDATNALASQNADLFAGTQELLDAQVAKYQQTYDLIDAMRQKDLISEQTAEQMKAKVALQYNELRLGNASKFFGDLSSLSKIGNAKIAAIGKAAAVTQATIDGVLAVQKALASAPPPVNYALAAAAGVAAAANVAQILSANAAFATGGQFKVGGTGGTDSQLVAFRATPGEHVAVSTPQQLRHGDPNGRNGQAPQVHVAGPTIINVRDPKEIPSAIQSNEGAQAIINVLTDRRSTIKQLLN
jgi:tape measure domain-containing protein